MNFSVRSLPSAAVAVVMGISLAGMANTATAAGQGPKAGIAVQTTCALDGTQLNVTVRIDNKTSGDAVAYVGDYKLAPVYKTHSQKGKEITIMTSEMLSGTANAEVGGGIIKSTTVELCDIYMDIPDDLRGISAIASIDYYGMYNGEVTNTGNITNACSDDKTTEAIEPAGIKLNWYDIQAACNP